MHLPIKFGDLEFSFSTSTPLCSGPLDNRPVNYSTEVQYENITPSVNVTKAKEPQGTSRPIKGAVIEGVPIQVVAQSEGATLHAVKKRCDHAPQADVGELFVQGHHMLMEIIHEREEIRMDYGMVCAYLDEMSGTKRERLGALLDSYDFTLPGYTDKVVFAKSEALLKGGTAQPRVVYQGGDMYNLVMGSVIFYLSRRIAEELSRSNPLNKGTEVIYCVGMSADEIADIVHCTPGKPLENDFKNNDGTQPSGVRKWEAMFYYKLGAPRWFVREFAQNTGVKIFTRYGVRGAVKGQRWSGEVTTTTGNGYVNSCISLAALKRAGITKSTTMVYGDDNLTYTSQDIGRLGDAFQDVAKDTGMAAETVAHDHREKATFLRKRFVPCADRTLPVPSFGRVLCKLPIRSNFNKAVSDADYMAGKILSAAYEHRHIFDIRNLLLETAEQLSSKPYLDMRNQAMAFKYTAEELRNMTSSASTIDLDHLNSFLLNVYGISDSELYDAYQQACDGILGFSRVNKTHGRQGKQSAPHIAPKLPRALWNQALECLISQDVSL